MRRTSRRLTCRSASALCSRSTLRSRIASISSRIRSLPSGTSESSSLNQTEESGMFSRRRAMKAEEESTFIKRSAAPEESRSILRNQWVSPRVSLSLRNEINALSGSIPSAIQRKSTGSKVLWMTARLDTPLVRAAMWETAPFGSLNPRALRRSRTSSSDN